MRQREISSVIFGAFFTPSPNYPLSHEYTQFISN